MILRRIFRLAVGTSLGKAVTQRSARWLSVAGGLILFRMIERLGARSARRAAKD